MGRRSRKRMAEPAEAGPSTSRAERDAARRVGAHAAVGQPAPRPGRTSTAQRPAALWAPFPLTELVVLGGLALMVWGLVGSADNANARIGAGLAIASIGGLELAVREHVAGFRSHTTLLAGAAGIVAIVALGLGAQIHVLGVLLIAGALAFAAAWFGLRELFKRRSGGLGFR